MPSSAPKGKKKEATKGKGKKEPPPPPPPPKHEPLYTFPLNHDNLADEDERLQEEIKNHLPILPSLKNRQEEERQRALIDPSVIFENEDYMFRSRADDYLKEKILNHEVKNSTLEISKGATDFIPGEDDELKKQILSVYKQPKAVTLLKISEGNSTLSNRGATSAYFIDDYDRFLQADVNASKRTSSEYFTSTIQTRNSQSLMSSRLDGEADMGANKELIDHLSSISISDSGQRYIPPSVSDPTWRTYSAAPTGRSVNSIYHPNTKRPSRMSSFIEKSHITNNTLFTYLSTEFVQELDLENCNWLNNKVLTSIGQYCPSLVTLNLQNCTQVIDSTIRIISNGCPELKFINLGMCHLLTDEAIKEIFRHCPNIRVLSAHSCDKITGDAFFDIKNCSQMEVLDMSYCSNLSDIALQYVSEYCPKLLHLDISGCNQVGDEGISSIYKHCSHLETLRMMLCDQVSITSQCLSLLSKFARSLKVLELTGVSQLTDDAAQNIAKYAHNTQFLSLNGCSNISDATLKIICQSCHNLRCVELCSCKKVTVQALLELIHTIKPLSRMVISECNISESEITILRTYSSKCQILKHNPKKPEKENYYVMYTKAAPRKKKKAPVKK